MKASTSKCRARLCNPWVLQLCSILCNLFSVPKSFVGGDHRYLFQVFTVYFRVCCWIRNHIAWCRGVLNNLMYNTGKYMSMLKSHLHLVTVSLQFTRVGLIFSRCVTLQKWIAATMHKARAHLQTCSRCRSCPCLLCASGDSFCNVTNATHPENRAPRALFISDFRFIISLVVPKDKAEDCFGAKPFDHYSKSHCYRAVFISVIPLHFHIHR